MRRFAFRLPGFVTATWVMTLVVFAIVYGLCLGTAEAALPHHPNPAERQ
jgi:hypothetical protein